MGTAMNAVQATLPTTERITYHRAVAEGICLTCGAPAVDNSHGAPYCSECKARHEAEMARARKAAHPGRFAW